MTSAPHSYFLEKKIEVGLDVRMTGPPIVTPYPYVCIYISPFLIIMYVSVAILMQSSLTLLFLFSMCKLNVSI
ncbi:hypothetical protein NBRC116494_02020 [Aurantivibrio plasticivorans]